MPTCKSCGKEIEPVRVEEFSSLCSECIWKSDNKHMKKGKLFLIISAFGSLIGGIVGIFIAFQTHLWYMIPLGFIIGIFLPWILIIIGS